MLFGNEGGGWSRALKALDKTGFRLPCGQGRIINVARLGRYACSSGETAFSNRDCGQSARGSES